MTKIRNMRVVRVKNRLRRLGDKGLRKIGLVRRSALPMREFSLIHHHPTAWSPMERRGPYSLPEIFEMKDRAKKAPITPGILTIEGTLRDGRRVTGDLKIVQPERISQ